MSGFDFNPSRNDFELFGFAPSFALNMSDLQTRYRELLGRYHPDRHAAGDGRARRGALQASTRINEAYQNLRDPRRRARCLLALEGVAFDDEHDTLDDAEFLMQQLELREALEDAEQSDNAFSALGAFMLRLRQDRDSVLERFAHHYAHKAFAQAKADVLQLSFFDRLLARADERLSALEDALD